MRAVVVLLAIGCNNTAQPAENPVDIVPCNLLKQTGCDAGKKCTWIHDDVAVPAFGQVGCAPEGSVNRGSACAYLPAGATSGYDDCEKGDVCVGGACLQICNRSGGAPECGAGFGCGLTLDVFGFGDEPIQAGECFPACDPLADNDFLGSGVRGSVCKSGFGCYGLPSRSPPATLFTCMPELDPTLVHRSACPGTCSDARGLFLVNACAQGYIPLVQDTTGSMQIDCVAMCAPAPCYAGNCGSNSDNLAGVAPHRCNAADARGTFNPATAGSNGNNGDQCMYSWAFEAFGSGFVRSPTSDTLGFCVDHSKYFYDPNGQGNLTTPWPKCDTLTNPGFGSNAADRGAADFGCVSTSVAGL